MVKVGGGWLAVALAFAWVAVAFAQGGVRFTQGEAVVALVNLNVRSAPGTGNESLGVQPAGARAEVLSPSPTSADGYLWWQLRWENGVVGWSAQGNETEAFLAAVDSLPSPAVTAASELFPDRWLRAFNTFGPSQTPRFAGPVAEVTRTTGSRGQLSEVVTWRFDERGWPTEIEWTLYVNETAYGNELTWHYDDRGLPTSIDWRDGQGSEAPAAIITWSDSSVEVTSDTFRARYSYDPDSDVLTADQTLPGEVRQIYAFNANGNYTLTTLVPLDGRTWTETVVAVANGQNIHTNSVGVAGTSTTRITSSDSQGNPTRAEGATRGFISSTSTIAWEIRYR